MEEVLKLLINYFMLKKRKKWQKKQGAFTFVEVLAAVSIVALVMTALGSMMALSVRVAEANEMEQLAQMKAQQSIEFFRRERLVRGWTAFYSNLNDNATYCLNTFPGDIANMHSVLGSCSAHQGDLNFFYYSIEATITKIDSLNEESVKVQIDIYRFDKSGSPVGDSDDAFYTVEQTFKKY